MRPKSCARCVDGQPTHRSPDPDCERARSGWQSIFHKRELYRSSAASPSRGPRHPAMVTEVIAWSRTQWRTSRCYRSVTPESLPLRLPHRTRNHRRDSRCDGHDEFGLLYEPSQPISEPPRVLCGLRECVSRSRGVCWCDGSGGLRTRRVGWGRGIRRGVGGRTRRPPEGMGEDQRSAVRLQASEHILERPRQDSNL